jgi:hypothetical protein
VIADRRGGFSSSPSSTSPSSAVPFVPRSLRVATPITKGTAPSHAAHAFGSVTAQPIIYPSFYYNYFRYGFDLFIDGQTQRLRKIVVHTNLPGHPDFCVYTKCPFFIEQPSHPAPPPAAKGGGPTPLRSAPSAADSTAFITDTSRDSDLVCFSETQTLPTPVINSRSSSVHPFGTTYYFGFDEGVVFEVTKTHYIASVCVFQ